jgi:uncharacterized protein
VSATLTSEFVLLRLRACTGRALAALLVAFVFVSGVAHAADNDADNERGSFFDYLPAAPDLKLPKIEIPNFWTDDLKKAKKAYRKGDYGRALKYFNKASEDGNAVADWHLGHMYRLGQGVPADPAVAYSYYSRVAENYDPDEADADRLRIAVDSQVHLARYQRLGLPAAKLAPDPAGAARSYLRLASNYGHPAAMFALGEMNIRGEGVKKNPQQGLKWLMAAARKRDPQAQAYLGELYQDGELVKQDETRALMWYILAAETAAEGDQAIHSRAEELRLKASDEVRLEAESRARVWSDQYPSEGQ